MMEWVVPVALTFMFGMCALMMLRMMLHGGRGAGRHGGFGMMCMGHSDEDHAPRTEAELLEELRTERTRLDAAIARADRARMDSDN